MNRYSAQKHAPSFDPHIGFAVKSETFTRVIHKYTSV